MKGTLSAIVGPFVLHKPTLSNDTEPCLGDDNLWYEGRVNGPLVLLRGDHVGYSGLSGGTWKNEVLFVF